MLKRVTLTGLVAVAVALSPAPTLAQGVAINHDPTIECFPVGKYTLVRAVFPEGVRIARARTYFRVEEQGAPQPAGAELRWFYIEMQPATGGSVSMERPTRVAQDMGAGSGNEKAAAQTAAMVQAATTGGMFFQGGLPKPKNELVDDHIVYYVQGETAEANSGQTQEYRGIVVKDIEECKKRPLLATRASPGSFPADLFGITAGVSTAAIAGGGAAVVAGVVAGVAAGGGDDATPTTTLRPSEPTTPTVTTPPGTPLQVTCSATPTQGDERLPVRFTATATGGNAAAGYRFDWTFAPGATLTDTANPSTPSFTYSAGQFTPFVRVSNPAGSATFADCRLNITVRRPDPCQAEGTAPNVEVTGAEQSGSTMEVTADATDASGIRSVDFTLHDLGCPGYNACEGLSRIGVVDRHIDFNDPYAASLGLGSFDGRCFNGCIKCVEVDVIATDNCGNVQSHPVRPGRIPGIVFNTNCTAATQSGLRSRLESLKSGAGVKGRKPQTTRPQGSLRKQPRGGASPRVVWTSELQVEGGRGQVVVNGVSAVNPGSGRAYAVSAAKRGENRMEGTLVTAAGKAGTWRFEFGANAIKPGTLRVVAGEVALVTNNAVVFRLRGTPGERVVFTFSRK